MKSFFILLGALACLLCFLSCTESTCCRSVSDSDIRVAPENEDISDSLTLKYNYKTSQSDSLIIKLSPASSQRYFLEFYPPTYNCPYGSGNCWGMTEVVYTTQSSKNESITFHYRIYEDNPSYEYAYSYVPSISAHLQIGSSMIRLISLERKNVPSNVNQWISGPSIGPHVDSLRFSTKKGILELKLKNGTSLLAID